MISAVIILLLFSLTSFAVIPPYNDTENFPVIVPNNTEKSEPIVIEANIIMPEKKEVISTTEIIAIISATAATGGLVYTGRKFRKDTQIHEVTLMKEIQDELAELEMSDERNSKGKTPDNYDVFAVRYLNVLDRLAYLGLKNLISRDSINYFKSNFEAGLGILELKQFENRKQENQYLIKWTDQEKIITGTPP